MTTAAAHERGTLGTAVLRRTFGCFPSGVVALCAMGGTEPVGMAASSFTSVSLDPPLVSVCVHDSSATWPRLRRCRRLGVSVLARDQERVCRSLSDRRGDRFAGVGWRRGADDAVLVDGAVAWLECSVDTELPAGDHLIVLLRIHALGADPEAEPLVFHGSRFRQLDALRSTAPDR